MSPVAEHTRYLVAWCSRWPDKRSLAAGHSGRLTVTVMGAVQLDAEPETNKHDSWTPSRKMEHRWAVFAGESDTATLRVRSPGILVIPLTDRSQ